MVKPANYKIREITQGKYDNPSLFQDCLVEAFKKYTTADPDSPERQALLGIHFITQSASDIRRKKVQLLADSLSPYPLLVTCINKVSQDWHLGYSDKSPQITGPQTRISESTISKRVTGNEHVLTVPCVRQKKIHINNRATFFH